MCHTSVLTWAADVFGPDLVTGKTVCEVGAYNVNGTVRASIEAHGPESYLGVDIEAGPGVDLVADVGTLPERFPNGFGLVVSTEMLEHVADWRAAIKSLVRLVAPGGSLAVTTRSPGFPYHPYPIDCWRYPVPLMAEILESSGLKVVSCVPDPEQAGVFAVASKPKTWREPKAWLEGIEVPGV
jgi:SAM-dependent methyltransferase